jgi:hypothetical protein
MNDVVVPNTSLRDMFAGQIYAAMLVAPKQAGVPREEKVEMARSAYQHADALMLARQG